MHMLSLLNCVEALGTQNLDLGLMTSIYSLTHGLCLGRKDLEPSSRDGDEYIHSDLWIVLRP